MVGTFFELKSRNFVHSNPNSYPMNPMHLLQRYFAFGFTSILLCFLFPFCLSAQGTFTDQSGNTYKTVRIGSRIWLAENLRTTRYANGEKIDFIIKPDWYISENGYTKLTNGQYLYTWAAVQDERGLAPKGWHIATPDDWRDLISNCKTRLDIRSATGWQSIKSGGYYESETCPNCIRWNAEYRSKVACHTCLDNRLVKGKYIPITNISMNGNDRFQFNVRQLGNMNKGKFSNWEELFWTSTLDTRRENCGSVCGQAYIFDVLYLSVDSKYHSEYMLPVRLVKDNNDFYDAPRNSLNESVKAASGNSAIHPAVKRSADGRVPLSEALEEARREVAESSSSITMTDRSPSTSKTVIRDNSVRKDIANVFYSSKYTLFDHLTDEPIFPDENGMYHIYCATNEDKTPRKKSVTVRELENMRVYKFKDYTNCANWCTKK